MNQVILDHAPSADIQQQLRALASRIQQVDGYLPELYWHHAFSGSPFYPHLFYITANKAVGWLKCFNFSPPIVECYCLVEPSMRRQGIATQLINRAIASQPHLSQATFEFSCSHPQLAWLLLRGAAYDHRHVSMVNPLKIVCDTKVTAQYAKSEDFEALISLDAACFSNYSLNAQQLTRQLLRGDVILIAKHDRHIVAKLHIRFEENHAKYYNICTHPDYRRQGLAGSLIASAAHHCIDIKQVNQATVDVEGDPMLIKFYQRHGFHIQTEHHFYRINNLTKLTQCPQSH